MGYILLFVGITDKCNNYIPVRWGYHKTTGGKNKTNLSVFYHQIPALFIFYLTYIKTCRCMLFFLNS